MASASSETKENAAEGVAVVAAGPEVIVVSGGFAFQGGGGSQVMVSESENYLSGSGTNL